MHRKCTWLLGHWLQWMSAMPLAAIAQLGERQTEDLKVPSSILGGGIVVSCSENFFARSNFVSWHCFKTLAQPTNQKKQNNDTCQIRTDAGRAQ